MKQFVWVKLIVVCMLLGLLTGPVSAGDSPTDIWDSTTFKSYSQAVTAYNKGDFKTARKFLETSLQDYPNNVLSLYLLGHTLVRLGENAKALSIFEKTLALYPNLPDVWAAMGTIQEQEGKLTEAVESYLKVAAREPDNPEWPKRLSSIAIKTGDRKSAEQYLRKWLKLEPKNQDCVVLLADLLIEQNQWDEAATLLKKNYPSQGNALMAARLAGGYFNRKQYKEAAPWFQQLARLEPKSAEHPYRLGFMAYKAGDKEKAEEYFSQALSLDPNHFGAAYNLAVIRMDQKRYKEAIGLLERCTTIDPQAKEPYLQLARIYEKVLLDPGKAQEYYRKAGVKAPSLAPDAKQ